MKESELFVKRNSSITNFFLHGYTLSIVMLGLNLTLQFLFSLTNPFIMVIGFLVAFVIFFILIGGMNSEFAWRVWRIKTHGYWLNQLGHGLILSILLGVIVLANFFFYYYLLTFFEFLLFLYIFVTFFMYSIIGGLIGKRVAEIFQIEPSDIAKMRAKSIKGLCPFCNTSYFYTESSVGEEGHVICLSCSKRYQISEVSNIPLMDNN